MGIPKAINRYKIVKLLGCGGMGIVYLAEDPILARKVALKIITLDPGPEPGVRQAALARFSAEAKALAMLDHPCIVQIYDAGEERNSPWISFQLVDGESLEAFLSRRGRLTIRRALLFTLDIASALQHAHCRNIMHRDVKPANILIDRRTGLAKLTDFGIIQAPWLKPAETGAMVGSPGYMSPEQIDGKEVDQRSDIFSLGIVLYQMLSGEHPFLKESLASTIDSTCRGDYIPLGRVVPEVSKTLESVVRRCLFADCAMRFNTAAELIDVLKPLVPDDGPKKTPDMSFAASPAEVKPKPAVPRTTVFDRARSFLNANQLSRIATSFAVPKKPTTHVIG